MVDPTSGETKVHPDLPGATDPALVKAAAPSEQARVRAILRDILDDGVRRGVFRKLGSPSVPLLIIAGLRGVQLHLLDADNPPKLDDAVDSLLEIFLEGICR